MKTQSEIMYLKANWLSDPCWDIEETEGFEEYKVELRNFRLAQEIKWAWEEKERLMDRAKELQCSVKLVQYIETLERKIKDLQEER